MTNPLARKPYPSDVTDAQWAILAPFIPEPGAWSPREPIARREIESTHPVPVANRMLVETDAPRFAQRKDGLPLFP